MSTVALKGKLELVETKETIKGNNINDDGSELKAIVTPSKEKKNVPGITAIDGKTTSSTRKVRKWHWKGKWAFGSHIDETFPNNHNITTPLPKNAHKLQPFHYYFEQVADPATFAVPSLAAIASLPTNANNIENDNARIEDETLTGVKSPSTHCTEDTPSNRLEQRAELSSPTRATGDDIGKIDFPYMGNRTRDDASTSLTGNPLFEETGDSEQHTQSSPSSSCATVKKKIDSSESCYEADSISNEKDKVPKSLAHGHADTEFEVNTKLKTCTREHWKDSTIRDDSGQIPLEKYEVDDAKTCSQSDSQVPNTGLPVPKVSEQDETTPRVIDVAYSATPKQLDPFLSIPAVSSVDPPFTEALSFFRQKKDCNPNQRNTKCLDKYSIGDGQIPFPPSGRWKGYFQNATVGRGKGTQRIYETFHLFLNACPGENALFSFDSVQNQMPPTHVQDPILVRGRGENQFGTFEICGYLDTITMVMEIQRQYVHVEDENTTRNPSPNKKKRQRLSTPVVTRHKSSRPYFTRKRQPSWKVKSQEETLIDEPHKRKRRKMNVETTYGNSESYLNERSAPSSIASTGSMGSGPDSVLSSTGLPINSVGTSRAPIKRKSSNPAVSARKRGSTAVTFKGSPKNANLAVTSNTAAMKLPPTGNSQKSKWRAAHFLYYQRHDREEQHSQQQQQQQQQHVPKQAKQRSPGFVSTNITTANPRYVIYEGEMVESKREGRGICLYSNNMLYEGEWKRNKEHGFGKIMTSDRTRIIYEGEFERGRMQGKGTYYYEQAESSKCTEAGARYIGEFKENMRQGIGKYYLPDKSVYQGMWNNGFMNGRGVFTWADNSFYDGEWKDGKRTGQGILKTSDGFYYDGMWVNNAMEGRGFAVYPNGQKYEGLFSKGRREGRGTLTLTNGVVYEGRFRDDAVDGQGTMKMPRATVVPTREGKDNFMIPISFQSDMSHIHTKAGFTSVGD